MANELRQRIRNREPVLGSWVSLMDPAIAEISAELEFDFALIDTEHTPNSLETVTAMARAVDAASGHTDSVVRVPWNDPVRIKRILDTGVAGLMVPMVGTANEAETFVEATRYPPNGIRGIASARASQYGLNLEDSVTSTDESILTIAQIETESGLGNVADIAAVEEIDALFIGPADLSAAIGAFGRWESDAFLDTVEQVLGKSHASDTPVGTLATRPEEVEQWMDFGFDFLVGGIDVNHIIDGNKQVKETYEAAIRDHQTE